LAFGADTLKVSVYATAGAVARRLSTPVQRHEAAEVLRRLGASKIYLEGRRGDETVSPAKLVEARDDFRRMGFEVVGAIATVAGKSFGVQENSSFVWLNWQNGRTRAVVADFFTENARIFDEITIDDFYCTNDTSEESERARGSRSWARYRQDLLVSLIDSMILDPARAANPNVRVVMKYPQWYDKFHAFGYDPARMSPKFSRIWVGTEVRNPETRRMGFTQPTMGYINFRWLASIPGPEVRGAWFDHIECTAQNFVDQAWQSVLAGAGELTLFSLFDVLDGHPGHALFIQALPELKALAEKVRGQKASGIAYYKPSGSDGQGDLFLMDYLAMLGLPIVPVSSYPSESKVAIFGAQAADDEKLIEKIKASIKGGSVVVCTPALLGRLGARAGELIEGKVDTEPWRLVTGRNLGRGKLLLWNVKAFSDADYAGTGERLLPPTKLSIVEIQRDQLDSIRRKLLDPIGVRLSAPPKVGLYLIGGGAYIYNFRSEPVDVEWNGRRVRLETQRLLTVAAR
jgi:hypothetical protein